jgi:PqqD family protein of HPr-rel-A system
MNPTSRFKIPTEVMARQVGDETVILDLVSGTYFGLNPVGARIWQLIAEGASHEETLQQLLLEYSVAPEDLRRDLDALLTELQQHGLLALA